MVVIAMLLVAGWNDAAYCGLYRCRKTSGLTARFWGLQDIFNLGQAEKKEDSVPEIDEKQLRRFFSYTQGEGASARLQREGLRSLLECTDSFCLMSHWLPDSVVENVYRQYAVPDGIGIAEFSRISRDGLLLEGKLEEYEKAFNGVDASGSGSISKEELGKLFAGLGRPLDPTELDRIIAEADAMMESSTLLNSWALRGIT